MNKINLWLFIGFLGQACFFFRFFVQWLFVEVKRKDSFPVAFWYLSILGAIGVLVYAVYRRDPVFIVGQSVGLLMYTRILFCTRKYR